MPVSGGVIAARDELSRSGATPGYGTSDRTIVEMRDHVYRDAIAVGRWVQETQCVAGDGSSDMNADAPEMRSRQPPFMLDTALLADARHWLLRIVCSPSGRPPRLEETRPHPWFMSRYAPLEASAEIFQCQLAEMERSLSRPRSSMHPWRLTHQRSDAPSWSKPPDNRHSSPAASQPSRSDA